MASVNNMDLAWPLGFWTGTKPPQHPIDAKVPAAPAKPPENPPPGKGIAIDWFEKEGPRKVSTRDMGWMLAQGWYVVGDFIPDKEFLGGGFYNMERNKLKAAEVTQTLIEQYVASYNEGRNANALRYEEVVVMWDEVLHQTQAHLNHAGDSYDGYETLFLTSLDSTRQQIDFYLNTTRSELGGTFDAAAVKLNLAVDSLSQLGTGYSEYKTDIQSILNGQNTSLSQYTSRTAAMLNTIVADQATLDAAIDTLEAAGDADVASHIVAFEAQLNAIETKLDSTETELLGLVDDTNAAYQSYETAVKGSITSMEGELTSLNGTIGGLLDRMDSEVASHKATYSNLVALYKSDYDTHAALTRGLLTDLGATETSRINEEWDNDLANKKQQLTDRGFFSSAMVTNLTTRNTRERSERLTDLNDRLAREKVANENLLYGNLVTVRDKQVAGDQYKFGLETTAIEYRAKWTEGLYNQAIGLSKTTSGLEREILVMKQGAISYESSVREKLYGWTDQLKRALADGKDRVYRIRENVTRYKTDNEFKLVTMLKAVRDTSLGVYSRDLSANLDVDRAQIAAETGILEALNKYVTLYSDGMNRYSSSIMQNGNILASIRNQCSQQAMQTRFRYCAGVNDAHLAKQKLYRDQLDVRNGVATGLFKFMEARTDSYPDLSVMGQIAMGLGDAGATQWVAPN